jgi:hypothetical protein
MSCVSLVPEWIKVEPVIRRESRVVLQPISIALRPLLELAGPPVAVQNNFIGEMFEMDFVTIASAIKAEEQNDRAMHERGDDDGASRECRAGPEKSANGGFVVFGDAIAESADEETALQVFPDAKQSVRSIGNNNGVCNVRVEAVEKTGEVFVVLDIHEHFELKALRQAECSQDFKAAEVRAEKETTVTVFHVPMEDLSAADSDIKALELAAQKIDAIENGGSEAMKMAKDIPPMDRPAEHTSKVLIRDSPRCHGGQDEIERDGIEQRSRNGPAGTESDAMEQAQRQRRAALGQAGPAMSGQGCRCAFDCGHASS